MFWKPDYTLLFFYYNNKLSFLVYVLCADEESDLQQEQGHVSN